MTIDDPAEHRSASRAGWESASQGWSRCGERIAAFGMPVAERMLEGVGLEPGQRVLEIAAGLGDVGLMAAARVGPRGSVIVSDQAEGMLAAARERAQARGVENVEFRLLDAESLDLDTASVDVALCRSGYMLMVDPPAALRETRRVLRPGGRLALAVWDEPQRNPWATAPMAVMLERGLAEPPAPGAPGMFALADRARLRGALEECGFTEIEIEPVSVHRRHATVEDFWQVSLELSRVLASLVEGLREEEVAAVRAALRARLEPFTDARGAVDLPGSSLVAIAGA
ncbi:MAG: methyltransferase domain-containing protein [Solirubrobacterales bacterium]|nr:methyltransferase domain-containing protein [Solirubrobacterales bacterium]